MTLQYSNETSGCWSLLVTFYRYVHWHETYSNFFGDSLVGRGSRTRICYLLLTMCVCVCVCAFSIIAAIHEQRGKGGWGKERISISSLNSSVHHQIFNSNKMQGPLSFAPSLSLGSASAPLIAMFTTCWRPESYVGSGNAGTENKGTEFWEHAIECADIRGSDMQGWNWALKYSKRE